MGFLERVPPQNLEAERSVLGGILLDNQAMPNVMEILQEEDFYRGAHRKLYQAMVDLSERRDPVDLITLTEEVNRKGWLQDVGGAVYLAALADEVPTAANIIYYARIVKEKSVLRQLIEARGTRRCGGLPRQGRADHPGNLPQATATGLRAPPLGTARDLSVDRRALR
jgi:replicative DNA helicase